MLNRRPGLFALFPMLAGGLALADPAGATGSIACADPSSSATVNIVLGAGPVPNVVSVTIVRGDRRLTTVPGQPGEQVSIAQAYDDGEVIRIDLVDQQALNRVAAIRILRADNELGPFQIGYVQVDDSLPVGITCEGP